MNVFHRLSLQGLKKNRTQTLVTVIGVLLSAALITGVCTFGVSLLDYMTRGAAAKYGDWHVSFPHTDASSMEKQREDPRVSHVAAFENIGYAWLEGSKNPDKPYLFLAGFPSGFSWEEAAGTLPIVLLSGRMPQNSGEILVPAHVAANGGVEIALGDTLTLSVGIRRAGDETLCQHDAYRGAGERLVPLVKKTYTVVGICQRPAFEERSAPGYTLFTVADTAGPMGSLSAFVALQNPFTLSRYVHSQTEPYVINDEVLRFMGLSSDRLFTTLLYGIGCMVMAIIITGSVFLIYNAFKISLNERMQQFGILASVGATPRQLRHLVLFEGLCIGATGIPAGILVGLGSIHLVMSAVEQRFGDILYSGIPLTVCLSIPVLIAAAAFSLVTILISAYIPARKAAATPVMACIRQTREIRVERKDMKTSPWIRRLFGLEGMLALKNFRRNRGRYQSIVLSLILSVVLFICTHSFVADLQQAARQATVFTTYDIGVSTQNLEDDAMQALYEALRDTDGVRESGYQTQITGTATVRADDLAESFWQDVPVPASDEPVSLTLSIQFLNDSAYLDILESLGLPADAYTGEDAKLLACAKLDVKAGQELEASEIPNLFVSSGMELTVTPLCASGAGPGRLLRLTFADFVPPDCLPILTPAEDLPYSFQVIAPYSLKSSLMTEDTLVTSQGLTFLSDTSVQSAAALSERIEQEGMAGVCTVYNMNRMLEESRNYVFIANVFAYTFIAMITLIAIANVFNTISTNILLRRRELAMLRSVGMDDRAFNRMMRFECALYGLWTLLIGLPLSCVLAYLIHRGMADGGAQIHFVFPWASMGISVIGVFGIILLTMLYATEKIRRANIIDALRDEMA